MSSGEEIYQAYVGSSANPGFADFAVAARIVSGRQIPPHVSFDVNSTSRHILENLAAGGYLGTLIRAGALLHQAGCTGCIGMGQAPASGQRSLRTTPRNLPGRPEPDKALLNREMLVPPSEKSKSGEIEIMRGPNIKPLPDFEPMSDSIKGPVLLKAGGMTNRARKMKQEHNE